MNLREHLRHILPEILPPTPAEAIKGTELIRLVRYRLGDDYSDATLRYHFSILSYDPTSPIAKVDQGQGYYLRQRAHRGGGLNGRTGLFDTAETSIDSAHQRYAKALAIYERLGWQRGQFPFVLNGRAGSVMHVDGDWEVPDIVCADWEVETGSDEQPRFDETMLSLRRHLGGPEVGLMGVALKLTVSLDSFPSEFFQALSATRWTTQGELIIAEAVTDEALGDALRSLGHQFGVGILSLGVSMEALDDLPEANTIHAMTAGEFEAVQGVLHMQRITTPAQRSTLDWVTLASLRKKHPAVSELVRWLNECLEKRLPLR